MCKLCDDDTKYGQEHLEIIPRRSLDGDRPGGLLESDRDFVLNNLAVCVRLLEALPGILDDDDLCAEERIEAVYELFE